MCRRHPLTNEYWLLLLFNPAEQSIKTGDSAPGRPAREGPETEPSRAAVLLPSVIEGA